uniref:Uncharacterized protein n=1 Tax=Strongyloides papillosus TaxID=174720 RepID=A0A0N5BHG4_STREA
MTKMVAKHIASFKEDNKTQNTFLKNSVVSQESNSDIKTSIIRIENKKAVESSGGATGIIIAVVVLIVVAILAAVGFFLYKKKSKKSIMVKTAILTGTETDLTDIKIEETQQPSLSERRGAEKTAKLIGT